MVNMNYATSAFINSIDQIINGPLMQQLNSNAVIELLRIKEKAAFGLQVTPIEAAWVVMAVQDTNLRLLQAGMLPK